MSYLGWRWTQYLTCIMAVFFGTLGLLIVPETYAPILLQRRAKKRRLATKNMAYHSDLDKIQITPKDLVIKYLYRPFEMLLKEPILLCSKLKASLFLSRRSTPIWICVFVYWARNLIHLGLLNGEINIFTVFQSNFLSYIVHILHLWSHLLVI
jgi:hypothetical protein